MNVAVCHRCVGERHRQIESCQRAQTTHRVATDLGRSAIRNAEIAGNVLGVSAASTVKAVVELGRSTVRGMSSVLQRDDEDDKERTEVDVDDKHDFESVGADVGETVQDNSAASQAIFHQVHTPRQELSTSSKLDGDQICERKCNTDLVLWLGVFWWSWSRNTQSLQKTKEWNELCVETVSLDRNFPLEDKLRRLIKIRVDIWLQYCPR